MNPRIIVRRYSGRGTEHIQKHENEQQFGYPEREIHGLQPRVLANDGEFDEDPDHHAEAGNGTHHPGVWVRSLCGNRGKTLGAADHDAEEQPRNQVRPERSVGEIVERNPRAICYDTEHAAADRGHGTEVEQNDQQPTRYRCEGWVRHDPSLDKLPGPWQGRKSPGPGVSGREAHGSDGHACRTCHNRRVELPEIRWIRPEIDEPQRAAALAIISAAERERYDRAPLASRDTFLQGRVLLRRFSAELTGMQPGKVPLTAHCPDCGGPHGQPVLVGSHLRLSLSRCSSVIVAAAIWGRAIGVDVERVEATAERRAAVRLVGGVESTRHWTRVEATLKADGRGLRVDPRQVMVSERESRVESSVLDRSARYRLTEPHLDARLHLSVAVAI